MSSSRGAKASCRKYLFFAPNRLPLKTVRNRRISKLCWTAAGSVWALGHGLWTRFALHAVEEADAQAHRQREAAVLALELDALAGHEALRLAVARGRAQPPHLVARHGEARRLARLRGCNDGRRGRSGRKGGARQRGLGEMGEEGEDVHAIRAESKSIKMELILQ